MSDPFLQNNDSGALRQEIRLLQQELQSLRQTSAQQKVKIEMLSQHQPSSDGSSKAKSKQSGAAGKEDSETIVRLKDEIAKLKKEIVTVQGERDKLKQDQAQHQLLLDAVAVAACERQQRVRSVCAEVAQELLQARKTVADLQKQLTELRRPGPPQALVPALPHAPPTLPAAPAFPVEETTSLLAELRCSVEQLELLLLRGGVSSERAIPKSRNMSKISASAKEDNKETRSTKTGADQKSEVAGTFSSSGTAPAAYITPTAAALQAVEVRRRGRPPKALATSSADASSIVEGRPAKSRRIEKVSTPQELPESLRAYVDEARSRRETASGSAAASSGKFTATLSSGQSSSSQLHFSEDPLHDVYELQASISPLKRQLELERLSKQLFLHYNGHLSRVAAAVVQHYAAAGQKWPSRDVKKRSTFFAELLFAGGGVAALDAWLWETVQFCCTMVDAEHLHHAEFSTQSVPVAASLRHVTDWMTSSRLVQEALRSASVGGMESRPLNPLSASYLVMLKYLQTLRRGDMSTTAPSRIATPKRKPLSPDQDVDVPDDVKQLLAVLCAFHVDPPSLIEVGSDDAYSEERGDLVLLSDPARSSSASSLLSLTMHGILADIMVSRDVPLSVFYRVADACGWSRTYIPLHKIVALATSAAASLTSSQSAMGKKTLETADLSSEDAIHALRLLVLHKGFQLVNSISQSWHNAVGTSTGGSSNSLAASSDSSFIALLSFVALDFRLRDDRDAEWKTISSLLGDFLSTPKVNSPQHKWTECIAAAALMHMCTSDDEQAPPQVKEDAEDHSSDAISQKQLGWRVAESWWKSHGTRDVVLGQTLLGTQLQDALSIHTQ